MKSNEQIFHVIAQAQNTFAMIAADGWQLIIIITNADCRYLKRQPNNFTPAVCHVVYTNFNF